MSGKTVAIETELLVVGGGPAGCAAAVMAASLSMPAVLVEAAAVGEKLTTIGALDNVAGGPRTGPELARRLAEDLARTGCPVLTGRITTVRIDDDTVVAETSDRKIISRYAVIATGVRPQRIDEAGWIEGESDAKPIWYATPPELADAVVLGVDRPLGTVLRTHSDVDMRLTVYYEPGEGYKAAEVADDPRVELRPTKHLRLSEIEAQTIWLNLGSRPVVPGGDVVRDASGYCPPEAQHPRILIAGDLRGAAYQRVMTALGSGAEAALSAYYAGLTPPPHRLRGRRANEAPK